MRLIVYLLIAKGVLFAVTMMMPERETGIFGTAPLLSAPRDAG